MRRTSLSAMMVPNQNLAVFCCKTTMWSCLSGTACSHVCSRTSSCFRACYCSSFPENLATSSHRFVLQIFFYRHAVRNILLPTRSESQADMMVGTYPAFVFCSQLAPTIVSSYYGLPFSVIVVQDHLQKWSYHGSHPFSMISKKSSIVLSSTR